MRMTTEKRFSKIKSIRSMTADEFAKFIEWKEYIRTELKKYK